MSWIAVFALKKNIQRLSESAFTVVFLSPLTMASFFKPFFSSNQPIKIFGIS